MDLSFSTLSDDALRARLRRSARERMEAGSPRLRAAAGQGCLESIAELQRRGAPLWQEGAGPCACGCGPRTSASTGATWPAPRVAPFGLARTGATH